MSRIQKLSQEKKKDLTDLLLSGITTKEAAALTETTLGRASAVRAKLVDAGIMARRRKSRMRSKQKPTTKAVVHNAVIATPIADAVKAAKVVASAEASKQSFTPDLTPVLGTEGFIFRINNMEVQISDAQKVHVKKGVLEIKF